MDPSFNPETAKEGEEHPELEALPLIVIVIDEYADMLGALAQEDRAKSKRLRASLSELHKKPVLQECTLLLQRKGQVLTS